MKQRLILLLLTLLSISSCKWLPDLEVCKYKYDTDLCLCKMRDMFTGQSTKSYVKDSGYCFRGVIISEKSWPALDSFLLDAGKSRKFKRYERKFK